MIPEPMDRPVEQQDGGEAGPGPAWPSVLPAFRDGGPLTTLALETEQDGRFGVWEWHVGQSVVQWSPGLFALLGVDPATRLTLDDLPGLIVPEDRDLYRWFFDRCMAGDPPKDTVFRLFGPDERVLHVRTRVRIPDTDLDGRPRVIRGTVVDISDLVDEAHQREIARDAAETARRRLEDAIAAIGEGFALWDPQDRLELWNQRFEDMYTAVRSHLHAGLGFQDFLRHCLDAGLFLAARGREETWLTERMREHGGGGATKEHLLSNGHWYRFVEHRTSDGSFVGLRADITQEKLNTLALQESEERYRALFQGSRMVQLLLDPDTGHVVDCNDAACRYYGYARHTLLSLNARDINVLPFDDVHALIQRSAANRQSVFVGQHRLASGVVRDVETHSGPVTIMGRQLIYAVVHDIGERIDAEAQREALLTRLERSNADLEHFAHVASHDLREPLRTITTSLGLILRRHGENLPTEARTFMDFALTGARDLDALIVDLLDYTRASRDDRPLSVLCSRRILDDAVTTLSVGIEETDADVTWDADPWPRLRGEPRQLSSLFVNLIGNALKYRRTDQRVRIHLSHGRMDHDGTSYTCIGVADNGIGIPADQRERIFLIFQRLHTRETFPGTGMGLAIARKVVDRCDGHILVESEEGLGTTFKVLFPVVPPGDDDTA